MARAFGKVGCMYGEQHPARVALREARETTIEQLSESFAKDELSLDEFEARVDRAYAAVDCAEVRALVSDLTLVEVAQRSVVATSPAATATETARSATSKAIQLHPSKQLYCGLAIFGNIERRGQWVLAPESQALAVFGNVELDLREAVIPDGVSELHVKAIFGNVEIIVPPTVSVESHGVGIFGNFDSLERMPVEPDGGRVLRIMGKSIFGNVEVSTLPPRATRRLLPAK